MSISVIVPTMGRPTLLDTILSIIPQLEKDDELIVVSDGLLSLHDITELDSRIRYYEMHRTKDSGNTQRDYGISVAKGTSLVFCDDDDIFTFDALHNFRLAINGDPNCLWIFRMEYGENSPSPGLVLWQDREVRVANVGTPMFLLPNRSDLPKWKTDKDLAISDFFFLTECLRVCYDSDVESIRWSSNIVCLVRPSEREFQCHQKLMMDLHPNKDM
jgi:glycosyltransferase involved in cell wall biosynthesis